MAKLELGEVLPLENTSGKYLEVMGVTPTDIVVIGSGGKTASIPFDTIPDVSAKDVIYLSESNEITSIERFNRLVKKAIDETKSQQNSHRGAKRGLDTSVLARSV